MFGNFKLNGICHCRNLIGFVFFFIFLLDRVPLLANQSHLASQMTNQDSPSIKRNKKLRVNKRRPASSPEIINIPSVSTKKNKNKWSVSGGLLTFSVLSENSANVSRDHLSLFANTWSGAYQIQLKNNWSLAFEPQIWLARLSYLQSLGLEGEDGVTANGLALNTKIIKNLSQEFFIYGYLGAVTLGIQSQGRIPKSVVITLLEQPQIYSGIGVQSFFYKTFFLDVGLALISSNPGQTQSQFQVGYQF